MKKKIYKPHPSGLSRIGRLKMRTLKENQKQQKILRKQIAKDKAKEKAKWRKKK